MRHIPSGSMTGVPVPAVPPDPLTLWNTGKPDPGALTWPRAPGRDLPGAAPCLSQHVGDTGTQLGAVVTWTLEKRMEMGLFASRLAKQNFLDLHFSPSSGPAADVVACPRELLCSGVTSEGARPAA